MHDLRPRPLLRLIIDGVVGGCCTCSRLLLALFDVSLQRSVISGAEGIASPFSLRTDDGRYWR
jgi:hypothetical protein